jgi:hypothetical protein
MTGAPLSFGEVVSHGYGYTSVLKAIERLILMRSPTLPNQYPANFEGITRALWDLGTVLSGDVPPPATSVIGPQPPGWDSATNDYSPGQGPGDGSFWFDTRQGRLFVSKDGDWHQTNGGEGFVHIGESEPGRKVSGAVWFDTRQGVTFVYIDEAGSANEPGWYQLNGGAISAGEGESDLTIGQLLNVSDSATAGDIPAVHQVGVLMRDGRSSLSDPQAYRVSNKIDCGTY